MSSKRVPKYPACSLSHESRPSFSFSKASTPFHTLKACVAHLIGRLFPGQAEAKPAPAGHEADLDTLLVALAAGLAASPAKPPVLMLHIYRGELEGVWPVELAPGLDLTKHLDELLWWRRNDTAGNTSKIRRASGRKGYHCAATARLAWGTPNPKPGS